jgi:hypothetical protein
VARHKRRDHEDHRKEHQADGDVPHERRRRPYVDPSMRAVVRVAPYDQGEADQRDQREQSPLGRWAELGDRTRARLAERHEDVGPEKDQQAKNENT